MSAELSADEARELSEAAAKLPPEVRREVAALWLRAAQLEHASIASFSRFSLELLSAGAPPQLVEGAHRAALDEVRHAKLCFAVASAYAGAPLGPGPLPLDARAFQRFDLVNSAVNAVLEGCVVETLSALEAAAAADLAEPAALTRVLTLLSAQEQAHAELAYRFVGWAVGHPGVKDAVARAVEQRLAFVEPPPPDADQRIEAHGRLTPKTAAAVRAHGMKSVVQPALRALLTGSAS